MVRFINKLTGGEMWVDASRVDEYKAAGHKLAADPAKPIIVKPATRPTAKKSKKK